MQANTGGSDAVKFDELCYNGNKEGLKEILLDRLSAMFGIENIEDKLAPEEIKCTRWSQEDLFRGAWFQFGPFATPANYTALFENQGNLIFSGEAVCRRFYGFVHGALLAGWRDSNRVLALMNAEGEDYVVHPETRCEMLPSNNGRYGGRWRVGKNRRRGGN